MAKRKTMTLNLTSAEMEALEELAHKKELTKTAVIRQALRLYQMVDERIEQGEKLFIENETEEKRAELMVL
jgi:predicted transcriptional regulator